MPGAMSCITSKGRTKLQAAAVVGGMKALSAALVMVVVLKGMVVVAMSAGKPAVVETGVMGGTGLRLVPARLLVAGMMGAVLRLVLGATACTFAS